MDVHEQRVRFVVAATQKARPFSALCAEYEISRPTGYLWLERYRKFGVEGIAEQSRRPHHSPWRTDAVFERQVVRVRRRYPDWGARKLQVVLAREGVELPRNTIHRILLRHDLVREEDRHVPAVQRFERGQPNELWQMDFKGPKGWPQAIGPLSVLDDHSRYLIALAANGSTHGQPVRERLEEAFQRSPRDADGSWHAVVEHEIGWGTNASVVMAHAARDSAALERHSTSANTGESGTFSRIAATGAGAAGLSGETKASVAGCVSLGA